jgi:hypothetical protein
VRPLQHAGGFEREGRPCTRDLRVGGQGGYVSLKTPSRPDSASVPWLPRAVTEKCNFTEPEVRLWGFLRTSHSERNCLENREDGVSSVLFVEVRRQNRPLRSSYRLMEVPVLGLLGISKQFQNGRSRKFVASWGRAPHTTLYVVDQQISSSDRAYVRALAGNSSSHNQFCSESRGVEIRSH